MKLVISVEGGIVQSLHGLHEGGDIPPILEVVIVDYDTDGVPDEELSKWEFEGPQQARIFGYHVDFDDRAWVEKAFALAG